MGTYHIEDDCKKCGRTVKPVKILKEDKKKKKWLVSTCPKCDYESDVEPYTKNYKIESDD
jgi:DNA-directed RNA polymerase subunit M/transcription elongation factor TFIIS